MPIFKKSSFRAAIAIKYLQLAVLLPIFASLSACYRGPKITQNCEFAMQDQIPAVFTPEAVEIYELAKAYDGSIYRINQMPEPGPPVDPKYAHIEEDRVEARRLYKQAAELGHVDAMYRLATFMIEGLGLPNDGYKPDVDGAYYWFNEVARRDDPFGYYALANFYLYGIERRVDVKTGEQCLVQAAKRGLMHGQISLAQRDLGRWYGSGIVALNPAKVERGIALLEDAALQGEVEAFEILGSYYETYHKDWLKYEYYMRESIKMGSLGEKLSLASAYKKGTMGQIDLEHSKCIRALKLLEFHPDSSNSHDLETLCPRPDGPLTRERVGLPPAPTTRLDLRAYLADFQQQHPNP